MIELEEALGVGDGGEVGGCGVGDEVIPEETTKALDGLLAVGRVENGVVDIVDREGCNLLGARVQVCPLGSLCDLVAESTVGSIESGDVGDDGDGAIDFRVLGRKIGLVEIVGVGHVVSVDGYISERKRVR